MNSIIDLHDLPEKDVQFIRQLVDLLKEKKLGSMKKISGKRQEKRIKLPTYSLGAVRGSLSRKEIYDYL